MKSQKTALVVGLSPDQYKIADPRLNKPVCHRQIEEGEVTASMLLQDLETAPMDAGGEITYFCPNNVAVLLSISSKSLAAAARLYKQHFDAPDSDYQLEKTKDDKRAYLNRVSSTVCDYIEQVQTSVVFAYTALETFANLSIPPDYLYQTENKAKGVREVYDKEAIERWINLKVKVQYILTKVYRSAEAEDQKWWGHFSNLERHRNEIVHQKTVNSTRFYKDYFKRPIFSACQCPLPIIKFFYEAHAESNRTNPIWPWLVNERNYFPVVDRYDSRNFEVIGNLYEGIKR